MLCVNSYPQEYIDECRSKVGRQLRVNSIVHADNKLLADKSIRTFLAFFVLRGPP
jgi:hypothetical protein